jgi:hypothetical protein
MSDTQVTGWVGWGWFAALLLLIAGVFDAIKGFIAVLMPNSAYFVTAEGALVFDVAAWGWWHIIIGVALILVAGALFAGQTWARVVAVILVVLNAIGQLFLLPVAPWWAIIVLTIDILIIYALIVHGRELKAREAY